MKKLFKTLLAVMIAVIMSFAVIAFAGCNPKDPDDKDKKDPPETPTIDIEGSTPEITALLKSMVAQKTDYIGMNMSVNSSDKENSYNVDENGTKKNDGYSYNYESTYKMNVGAKINAAAGNGDIAVKTDSKSESTTKYSSNPKPSINKRDDNEYNYVFLRDWNIFVGSGQDEKGAPAEITDFSNVTLMWVGDIEEMYKTGLEETGYAEMITEVIEGFFGGEFNLSNLAPSVVLPYYGFMPAMLADSLGAFTLDGNKATADYNLAAYNLVQKVKGVLDTINSNTTVGDILANETVKSLITAYTASLTADDVKGYIDLAIDEISQIELEGGATIGAMLESMHINLSDYIVAPDANSTVYDYIVKIVSSNELRQLLDKALEELSKQGEGGTVISMPANLNAVRLDFFLNLAGTSVEQIKELFNEYTKNITATEFKLIINTPTYEGSYGYYDKELEEYIQETYTLNIPTSTTVSLKNLKLEYTLDENTVTAMSMSCNYSYTGKGVRTSGSYDYENGKYEIQSISLSEETESTTVSMQVQFPSTAYTLENINGNDIVFSQTEWTDECNGKTYSISIDGEELGVGDFYTYIRATLSVKDGKVSGVTYKDEGGKTITVDKDGKATFNYTYHDWRNDKDVTVLVTIYLYEEESDEYYEIYATKAPVEGNNYHEDYISHGDFRKANVYYGNTVDGILKGTPSEKLPL